MKKIYYSQKKPNKMDIYKIHTREIRKSRIFQTVVENIMGDMLMHKVHSNNDGEIFITSVNHKVLTLIREWYLFARYLSYFERKDIYVFRGVKNMNPDKNHLQPIPFSSCLCLRNTFDWIIPNKPDSYIMCIYISRTIIYTFTGNFSEGNEVILPAGYLIFLKKIKYKNTFIVFYDFLQLNLSTSLQLCQDKKASS